MSDGDVLLELSPVLLVAVVLVGLAWYWLDREQRRINPSIVESWGDLAERVPGIRRAEQIDVGLDWQPFVVCPTCRWAIAEMLRLGGEGGFVCRECGTAFEINPASASCPGHGGGQVWCAHCGDLPSVEELEA